MKTSTNGEGPAAAVVARDENTAADPPKHPHTFRIAFVDGTEHDIVLDVSCISFIVSSK